MISRREGTHSIYQIEFYTSGLGVLSNDNWHTSGSHHVANVPAELRWGGSGNGRHELSPFHEVHDGWQKTGTEGWLDRSTALAALKLVREHNPDVTFRLVHWDWTFARTIASELPDRDAAARAVLAVFRRAEADASWKDSWDAFWSAVKTFKQADPDFNWYDPDTTYEDDMRAVVDAIHERCSGLEK